MPKSSLLAVVALLVVIGVLLFAWRTVSRPANPRTDGAPEPQQVEAPAPSAGAQLEATGTRTREDVGSEREERRSPPATQGSVLRIEVRIAAGRTESLDGLEVTISNRLGGLFQPRHTAANVFELVDAPPDVYLVVARAPGHRTALVRAVQAPKQTETKVTITLEPVRTVLARWHSADGRPILASSADRFTTGHLVQLEVFVTKFPCTDGFRPADGGLAHTHRDYVIEEGPDGAHVAREAHANRLEPPRPKPSDRPDAIGFLEIEEDGAVWGNAFCNGELILARQIQPGASEFEIVTEPQAFDPRGGTVTLAVIDEDTGAPIEDAGLTLDVARMTSRRSDERGVLTQEGIPPGRHRGRVWTEGRGGAAVDFISRTGETVNLGTIRLPSTRLCAPFRVVDAQGVYVPDATFELVAIEAELEPGRPRESFVATSAPPRAAKGTAPGANLRFDDVERRAYLLRCRKKGLDSAPRLVTAAELKREGDAAAIAEIVVREAFVAGFVLDPPIARGTHVVIESTSGQPLRELHVDEFGVAVTDLFEGAYRLHLVEYGRATGAVDVRVDRNPFVFEIHR